MAGSGGLRIAVTAHGFEAAKKQLESLGRKVEPVLRGALDSTAMGNTPTGVGKTPAYCERALT